MSLITNLNLFIEFISRHFSRSENNFRYIEVSFIQIKIDDLGIACCICANSIKSDIERKREREGWSSTIRFAFYATALHSNRGAVQQCVFLDIPLVYLRPSYDFLWTSVFEVDPGSRSTENGRDSEWTCRTTKKNMLVYISFALQVSSSFSLTLSLSVFRSRWLRKFKLPSHKRGNKKFARKAVLERSNKHSRERRSSLPSPWRSSRNPWRSSITCAHVAIRKRNKASFVQGSHDREIVLLSGRATNIQPKQDTVTEGVIKENWVFWTIASTNIVLYC